MIFTPQQIMSSLSSFGGGGMGNFGAAASGGAPGYGGGGRSAMSMGNVDRTGMEAPVAGQPGTVGPASPVAAFSGTVPATGAPVVPGSQGGLWSAFQNVLGQASQTNGLSAAPSTGAPLPATSSGTPFLQALESWLR